MIRNRTIIVTGASQGIGAGLVEAFLGRGYNVVANSRKITSAGTFLPSESLALVDGDIGDPAIAKRIVQVALERFGSIDALVNNAGIFVSKAFTEYTAEDFRRLVSTNLEGFIYITQRAIAQMRKQERGGSVVSVSSTLARHPNAALPASVSMITKGGIEAISKSLAVEYAKDDIRVNVVAPGIVDTPIHAQNPKAFLQTLSPLAAISDVREIADSVVYLTEAKSVTGEVLYVDGGAHVGKW